MVSSFLRGRMSRWLAFVCMALFASGMERAAWAGQGYLGEVEPNGTSATASPIAGTNVVVRANLFPNGDIDFYSFTANAGDRIYAATMTSFSAGSSTDSQLTLLASDGTTVIEFDDDNGSFAGLSSSIAGATIPTTGTYFLKVNDFTAGTTTERPYELHLRVQSGAPTPEVESNDTPATANPLPANGWVSGARNPAAATEQDWYSFTLNAGDTVYLGLDLDPERDGVTWNGRLGLALFGDAGNQILVVDDAGTGDVTPNPNIPSEALFFTVKTAGTYFAFVDSASAATGGPTATYQPERQRAPGDGRGRQLHDVHQHQRPADHRPGDGPRQLDHHRAGQPADRRPRRQHRAQPRADGGHRRPPALAGRQRQRAVHRHRRRGHGRADADGRHLRRRGGNPAELHGPQGTSSSNRS